MIRFKFKGIEHTWRPGVLIVNLLGAAMLGVLSLFFAFVLLICFL